MNPTCCPVACAIKDHFAYATVTSQEIEVDRQFCKYPRSVYRFVQAFDLGKPVKPFRFRLETA